MSHFETKALHLVTILALMAAITAITGCANDAYKNHWKGSPSQNLNSNSPNSSQLANDSSDEWTIVLRDRVIFIKKQPGFINPIEKFMEAVYAKTWSRNISESQLEINEVLRIIVTDKLKQSGDNAIKEMAMLSDESARNICMTGFQSKIQILQNSEFYLLKTSCEIHANKDLSLSSFAILFRDQSNVYKLEWIIPGKSGNAMKFDDKKWEKIKNNLLPVRTCKRKPGSNESTSSCDWFAMNTDDVIQRMQQKRD